MSGIDTNYCVDMVNPDGRWGFNQDVTNAFDDMLKRSIPEYELMRASVNDLIKKYMKKETCVMDLGCSRGEAIAPLVEEFASNDFICCDMSVPMLEVAEKRFKKHKNVSVHNIDLRNNFPSPQMVTSVILSVLTIQFTPIEYRLQILKNVYDTLQEGGCFILVEKVIGNSADLDRNFKDVYYKMKKDNGYSEEQISRKRLSLEGVLVPVTAKWNEEMLRTSGFTQIDCFWRWMNFAGWIAVK
jgi:tRNA (cmo5U34)-methyltransferase